jgi:hypothetical protein
MVDKFYPTPYIDDGVPQGYWSPKSQSYAPADILLRYLDYGWELDHLAAVESYWHHGVRRTDIYYFTLNFGDSRIEMPVLANPTVLKLIRDRHLTVIRVNGGLED